MHVELGRWQSKYPGGLEPAAPDDGVEEEVPGWNGNPKLVAPLFRAYDERVRSLEQQLEACKAPTKKLEEQVQMVVAENEGLLKQLKAAYGGFSDEDGQSRPTLEKWFLFIIQSFHATKARNAKSSGAIGGRKPNFDTTTTENYFRACNRCPKVEGSRTKMYFVITLNTSQE